jgi:AAA15 family ATPase/GTPase
MDYHIKEIDLDKRFERYNIKQNGNNTSKTLPNLSKINIFVGANNSGKSRFLRQLAFTQKFKFRLNLGKDSPPMSWNIFSEYQ